MSEQNKSCFDELLSLYIKAVGNRGRIEAVKQAFENLGIDKLEGFNNLDELLLEAVVQERTAFVLLAMELEDFK